MRIGLGMTVLARGLRSGEIDGIATCTRELALSLRRHPGLELVPVLFGGPPAPDRLPGNAAPVHLPRFATAAALSGAFTWPMPGARRLQQRVDILHATDHLTPVLSRIPLVATVMDAVPLSHPHWVASQRLRALKAWLWKRTTRRADHLITISHFSKAQIAEHFNIPEQRISVIPPGLPAEAATPMDADQCRQHCARLRLPRDFFLFVGTLQPRKNLKRLLQAHRQLPVDLQRACPLVVVGRAGWGCDEEVAALQAAQRQGTVRWLRYLPGPQLQALMHTAQALLFPSLYEGFGLPVIEAFAAGLPVITSNTTALPEVAGDAALLVDPTDVAAMAAAMQQLLEDGALRQELTRRGRERLHHFDPSHAAARTIALYRELTGSPS